MARQKWRILKKLMITYHSNVQVSKTLMSLGRQEVDIFKIFKCSLMIKERLLCVVPKNFVSNYSNKYLWCCREYLQDIVFFLFLKSYRFLRASSRNSVHATKEWRKNDSDMVLWLAVGIALWSWRVWGYSQQ